MAKTFEPSIWSHWSRTSSWRIGTNRSRSCTRPHLNSHQLVFVLQKIFFLSIDPWKVEIISMFWKFHSIVFNVWFNVVFNLWLNVVFNVWINVVFNLGLNVVFNLGLNVVFDLGLNVVFKSWFNVVFKLWFNVVHK